MYIDTTKKNRCNSTSIIINYRNRIVFSTVNIGTAVIISFLFILLILSSLSLFVLAAVDMPPQSPSPSAPLPTPPPSPPITTEIPTNIPKTLPIIEQKKDPKDGGTILSLKSKDKYIETATKVSKNSDTKTQDRNRGIVNGVMLILDEIPKMSKENQEKFLKAFSSEEGLKRFSNRDDSFTPAEYRKGFLEGMQIGLELTDIFKGSLEKK
jgi:hypothetical protein